jgi:hypothetical protein
MLLNYAHRSAYYFTSSLVIGNNCRALYISSMKLQRKREFYKTVYESVYFFSLVSRCFVKSLIYHMKLIFDVEWRLLECYAALLL